MLKVDNPPPHSLARGPHTIVLDEQIIAKYLTNGDTTPAFGEVPDLDPATIRAIEIIRPPAAQQQYPDALGDVIRITRCFNSDGRQSSNSPH